MLTVTERYQSDAQFRTLVDMMLNALRNAQFSPTEIREAAMLAHILYEERELRPIMVDDIRSVAPNHYR